jgi:hypothetical protein
VGDGAHDDTAALKRAFLRSDLYCLDGEGRSYRVNGTLEAHEDFCLRNATLIQSLLPFDTSPYIRASCPVTSDPAAIVDCGDPPVSKADLRTLRRSLAVRTLLIRPALGKGRIAVTLDHVKVNRGRFPEAGSRADSAGIWIQGGNRVELDQVEITGDGKGYGLLVTDSANVTVNGLWVHDLVWSPYRGGTPLSAANIEKVGWNKVPIHEFRATGQNGAKLSKFYGVRIQEQLSCAVFSKVQNVRIDNVRISNCMARFDTGNLPWQTDGLDISRSSSDVWVDGAAIDAVMEGMDVVANGVGIRNLSISNVKVSNAFGFGLKLGYTLSGARLSAITVNGAGIAGVVLYGPVTDVSIRGAVVENIGRIVAPNGASFAPWPAGNRAGFRIDGNSRGRAAGTPRRIVIDDATVEGPATGGYEFGILNTGGSDIQVSRFRAQGFSKSRTYGLGQH